MGQAKIKRMQGKVTNTIKYDGRQVVFVDNSEAKQYAVPAPGFPATVFRASPESKDAFHNNIEGVMSVQIFLAGNNTYIPSWCMDTELGLSYYPGKAMSGKVMDEWCIHSTHLGNEVQIFYAGRLPSEKLAKEIITKVALALMDKGHNLLTMFGGRVAVMKAPVPLGYSANIF
jgi:hypothetical protein